MRSPHPDGRRFVIAAEPNAISGALACLAEIGEVHPLEGTTSWVLQVKQKDEPQTVWRRILACLPSAEWVAPVLVDEREEPHYPTGDISVRFDHSPSPKELERFASTRRLRLLGRNEFAPQQASFRPDRPQDTYLPDLVQTLAGEKGVIAAWANTRSQYRRA